MSKRENLSRQFEEWEALMAIFGRDIEDLRNNSKKPLHLRITLAPSMDCNGERNVYVKTRLVVLCSRKYPKTIPKINLEETVGISKALIDEFIIELHRLANSLKGEVMIYDLANSVQNFLHNNNVPPRGSFYDEMVEERKKREEEETILKFEKQSIERKNLLHEVEKRKEIYKKDIHQKSHRNIPDNNSHHRRGSSSGKNSFSESSSWFPNHCLDHRSCEKLLFPRNRRQIGRGACLEHYTNGCIAYAGTDLDTGQSVHITEWHIKYNDIEKKCISNCYWFEQSSCNGHTVEEFIGSLEKHINFLSQLNHKNLVKYECVTCVKKKDGLLIWLVQDNSFGTRLSNISISLGWCPNGLHIVAKSILDVLIYLHNIGISHCNLIESTIFFDNFGTIRCADFAVVPHLLSMITGKMPTQGDLPALGTLIQNLTPTLNYEIKDFVDKCSSTRTLSALELLDHLFITNLVQSRDSRKILNKYSNNQKSFIEEINSGNEKNVKTEVIERSVPPYMSILSIPNLPGRLQTEFDVLLYLGRGAFGDVLKVRNNLDNREYAIKRIPLPAKSKQLYKKMRREVELLSRLNHENVVRYFNSWIEITTYDELTKIDKPEDSDDSSSSSSSSSESTKEAENLQVASACSVQQMLSEGSSSSLFKFGNKIPDSESDSDSDSIVFQHSNNEEHRSIDIFSEEDETEDKKKNKSIKSIVQVMYIQMEFCEKSTLRLAIDEDLFEDTDRLWRLFREIVEGLSHIHQQGIIHRDLKPVNIFLDSRDQIKIGDFGLATTSFLALQNTESSYGNPTTSKDESKVTATGTGKVGTTLYVAPELTENASKSTYNQKVDMYTLGIIFFEMSNPPFDTAMERIQTILKLRDPVISIPDSMLTNAKYDKNIKIIRYLLNHDPSHRPSAEELLTSDLMPPAQLEARELQEMLRHVLDNPQSKAYKHLVARCLQQESSEVLQLTYHLGAVSVNTALEFIKGKVLNIFQKHGGIEISSPLLNPLSKINQDNMNLVRLMTHSGSVVVLPSDLRELFVAHIAVAGNSMLRRYSCDRIYREKKVFNFHPKQYYECAFDIITPTKGYNLVDAEVILIAYEIAQEMPRIKEKNMSIRMNHTNLLRAILIYCNVPTDEYDNLFENIIDFLDGKLSKFHFQSSVAVLMEKSKYSATTLIDLLLTEFTFGVSKNIIDNTPLKILLRAKGEVVALVTSAITELESIVCISRNLGVMCPMTICAGLPVSYRRASKGGAVWQIIAEVKLNRNSQFSVLCTGERYDTALHEYHKRAQAYNAVAANKSPLCGVGFSFSLDKLASAIGFDLDEEHRAIDVVVCVYGDTPPLKDAAYILRLLWSAGIRTGIVEAETKPEVEDLGKELGALHVILLGEHGDLCVRSLYQGRHQEHVVTRSELITYIQNMLAKGELNKQSSYSYESTYSSHSIPLTPTNSKNNYIPKVEIMVLLRDKLTANARKRLENQITQQMSPTLLQFSQKEQFVIIAVDVSPVIMNIISGVINPREIPPKNIDAEIQYITERFPQYRRYIIEIIDKIIETLQSDQWNSPVVSLFTTTDSSYRIII